MRNMHTSIVSQHLAARENNKILRTHPPQVSNTEENLPRHTCRTLAQLRTIKSLFLLSYLHTIDVKKSNRNGLPQISREEWVDNNNKVQHYPRVLLKCMPIFAFVFKKIYFKYWVIKKCSFAKAKIAIKTKIMRNLKKWLVPVCRTMLAKTREQLKSLYK